MRPTDFVLVSGSLAFDLLMRHEGSFLDHIDPAALQNLSVCFYTPHYARAYGGNGGSISWTLALLGTKTAVSATVGMDGQEYANFLRNGGVDVSPIVKIPDQHTATCIIGTDTSGHQITFFHDGANAAHRAPTDGEIKKAGLAIAAPTQPAIMLDMLRRCKASNVPCLFDPGQRVVLFTPEELREAMGLSAGMFVNAYEADLLAGRLGVSLQKAALLAPFLVVTQDAQGFTIHHDHRSEGYPRCDAEGVIDPTGAGDALRAGFITGLLRGWPLAQCGMLGAAVASVSVQHRGVIVPTLDITDVYARAKKAYGMELPTL